MAVGRDMLCLKCWTVQELQTELICCKCGGRCEDAQYWTWVDDNDGETNQKELDERKIEGNDYARWVKNQELNARRQKSKDA
jgi:hypothetical protein